MRSASRSRFRTIGIRKAELVEDGDEYPGEGKKSKGKWKGKAREVDEDCDEYLEKGKKSKGKGKARQVDEDMDIDEGPARSIDSTSTPPLHRQSAGTICIKQLSHPVPTTPTPGPSDNPTISATPCERCMHCKLACVFREGAFACIDCQ